MKLTTTIFINNDTSNPIHVQCVIDAYYEEGPGWSWTIEEIKSVELVVSDSVGVDITPNFLLNKTALTLLTEQVNNQDDQIIEALTEEEDENVMIDEKLYGRAI